MSEFRFAAAILVWLAPGLALAHGLGLLARDRLLGLATAYAFSAAVSTLAAFVCLLAGLPIDRFPLVLVGLAALALMGLLVVRRAQPAAGPASGRTAELIGWLIVLGTLALGITQGASFRFNSDAPDHVGTIREILVSGLYFPTEAFHVDAGILGADARKGLLHPVYAALSVLAGMDPLDFWLRLPALTAPAIPLAAYAFLILIGRSRTWAVVGAALALISWSGGITGDLVGISPFPNQIGAALFWVATGLGLAALERPRRTAAAAAGLAAFGAVAVHPMYVVFLALFYGIVGLGVVVLHRRDRARWSALIGQAGVAGILLLPYLVYRFQSYAPANTIHTELQGMLLFTDRLFIADPLRLGGHIGIAGPIVYGTVLVVLWRRWRDSLALLHVFWVTATMLFLTVNPVLVPILQKGLTYLVFRSFWLFPPALAAAVILPDLARSPRRALAWSGILVIAIGFLPGVGGLQPDRLAAGDATRQRLEAARARFGALDARLPERSVILADPITSYLLPAFTTHRVVCTFDQHAPPNDARGTDRLLAARDVLSPAVDDSTAWRLARRENAGFVLIDRTPSLVFPTAFWSHDPAAAALRIRQLRRSPFFTERPAPSGFALFAVRARSASPGAVSAVRRSELPYRRPPVGEPRMVREGIALVDVRVEPRTVTPGDRVTTVLQWRRMDEDLEPGGPVVSVRFDAVDGPGRGRFAGKLLRKGIERRDGTVYRFRDDVTAGGGGYPADRWPRDVAVVDTVTIRVPVNAVPGDYEIQIAVNRIPHMPNHRIRDYLDERDLYSGTPVDTIRVVAAAP